MMIKQNTLKNIVQQSCYMESNTTFLCRQIAAKQLHDHILKLTVIDSGRAKLRGVIGQVSLPLRDFVNETEQQLFKMDLEKEAQENLNSDLGEVLISLLYNETLNRLSVTVIEAKRLKVGYVCFTLPRKRTKSAQSKSQGPDCY